MLPKDSPAKHVVSRFSASLPAFTDIFDEESFYITFFVIVIASILGVFYVSKRVTLKDAGHID